MARKNQRNGHGPPGSSPFESGVRQVRQLLEGKHSKAAVEIAKDLHKRHAMAESEMLLVEAYQSRIRDLLKQGMPAEAKSLLNLVCTRFPGARDRLQEVDWDVRAKGPDLADLVAPLGDPNVAAEVRDRLESVIRQRVDDLFALAEASSLAPTHPLREAAGALCEAFRAVTTGVVEDEVLHLPQVSRRSPLASWKALIHAIAGFYRGEEDSSRKWLEAIAPDSVPARFIEPMQALLGSARGAVASPAAMNLIRSVGSSRKIMQAALASVEEAMHTNKRQMVLDRSRDALSLCRQCRPELVDKLRQHVLVRSMLLGFKPDPVHAAVGKPKEDAYWCRLMALGFEEMARSWDARVHIVECWEDFRAKAIRERWFAANSLEDGLLSLRMARMASGLTREMIEELLEDEPKATRRPGLDGTLPPAALLDAGNLFARACRGDPHSEVFAEWLAWAKQQGDGRADSVAELWRQTRDQDVAPLLWLVESSERRGAYQKSLKFLELAEQLDQLNPEVRKVRVRLLVAGVLRHFRQRKPHLASQGIERLTELPETLEGTMAPAATALRSVCCALDGDRAGTAAHQAALEAQLGDSAFVLLQGLADRAGLTLAEAGLLPAKAISFSGGALASLARTCALGDLLGTGSAVPEQWESGLSAALRSPAHGLDAAQLLVIGEAALRGECEKLAYQVSTAGMKAGAADARFLFLRARALPAWAPERSFDCLLAARELARRDREMELAGRVLDYLESHPAAGFGLDDDDLASGSDGFSMKPGRVQEIVDEERGNDAYPESMPSRTPAYVEQRKSRQSKLPRRRGRDRFLPGEEDDAIDELRELLEDAPPEIRQQAIKALERGENAIDILLGLLMDHVPPGAPTGARKERPPKFPAPEQGSLF